MEDIFRTIFLNTYTKEGLNYRVGLLKKFFEDFFFTKKGHSDSRLEEFREFLNKKGVSEHTKDSMMEWGEDMLNKFDSNNLYDFISKIQGKKDELPTITLYVPVDLNEENISGIGKWFRGNINKNMIIDLHVDHNASGGCMFVWNGVYYDFSLNYFMNLHRDEITGLIKQKDHVSK